MVILLWLLLVSSSLILVAGEQATSASSAYDLTSDDELGDLSDLEDIPVAHSAAPTPPHGTKTAPTTHQAPSSLGGGVGQVPSSVTPAPVAHSSSALTATTTNTAAGKASNDYSSPARVTPPPHQILVDSPQAKSPALLPEILPAARPSASSANSTAPTATNPAIVTVDSTTQQPVIIEPGKPPAEPVKAVTAIGSQSGANSASQTDINTDSDGFIPEVNTNQEGGNWVQKRIWWEQAEASFAQLTADNNQILQLQTSYFKQRTSLEKQLNQVLCDLNVEREDLVSFVDKLLESVSGADTTGASTVPTNLTNTTADTNLVSKNNHKTGAAQSATENNSVLANSRLKKLAIAQQAGLEKIKAHLVNLKACDDAFDQVLVELNKQIELCQGYEKQAWEDFKEIGRILNDKKAKALFYQVDGYHKNIQKILEYITGALKKFFDDQLQKAQKNSAELNHELQQLAAGGLDLRFEFDILAGRVAEPIDPAAAKLAAAKKAQQNQSWVGNITSSVSGFFGNLWNWMTSWFK